MECRPFEITLISANNLEQFTRLCRMKVFARVSIGGGNTEDQNRRRTPTDRHGGSNPAWNFTVNYTLNESMVQHYNTMLVIKLFSDRRLACNRYVGEVHTPMKDLFDHAAASGGSTVVTFPVQKGSASSQGAIRFSYRFGESVTIDRLLIAERVAAWTQC